LAGAWAAHALARQGVAVTVLERHGAPAQEASGNPAGLFHGTAHADEGTHAGWNQAAALRAARALAPWIEEGSVPGALRGLLRLAPPEQDLAALQALVARHEWPPEIVQALPAEAASDLAGTALDRPAWWFPQGGWVAPAALVERLLQRARRRFGVDVQAIRRESGEWLALDGRGQVIEAAPTLVLANGAEAARLWPHGDWPLGRSRGQLSWWLRAPTGAPPLQVPLAGAGYALALPDGRFLFGATAAPGDEDPALRPADHAFNLQRLTTLTGWDGTAASASLQGRVGWRVQTPDRLPIVGPVAAPAAAPPRPLQARWLAREPGLFALTALASRGLTWGPLAAEVLAAWVTGAPMPVPARLRDALDPARWALRAMRKA
jgi:tRNA 5-methylaminomethyl-2-thiouridine biosynthesis bifunctional protein